MPISFQMAPFAITVEGGYQSYTTNRSRRLRSSRRGLRGYGPSVSGAKDPFIRSVRTFRSVLVLTRRSFPVLGCVVHEQGLPNFLYEEEGAEGCRRFERYVG